MPARRAGMQRAAKAVLRRARGAGLVRAVAAAEPDDAGAAGGAGRALCGARLFAVTASSQPRSFWLNAQLTMLILLGAAIADSTAGKPVARASAIRLTVMRALALYAWAVVLVLERWRAARRRARTRTPRRQVDCYG